MHSSFKNVAFREVSSTTCLEGLLLSIEGTMRRMVSFLILKYLNNNQREF